MTIHDTIHLEFPQYLPNRLAWRLGAAGFGPRTVVGILAEESADAIVGMLAALKAWVEHKINLREGAYK